jgi:hypothetical protein
MAAFCVAALASLALLPALATVARSADEPASAADQKCLGCHGNEGLEKKLSADETLSLFVPGSDFAKSVHASFGCAGCHSDIEVDRHPPSTKDIKTTRDYSVASLQYCRGCHADKFEQWDKSIHASLVRDGSAAAPICTDCHSPHAVIKGAAATIEGIPCRGCHSDVYEAYVGSMHAKARARSDQSPAPICSGCHSAHDVKPVALGEGPKAACLGCHAGVLDVHGKWLPNAALHFDVVSCAACHSPGVKRRVDLMLYDSRGQKPVADKRGVPVFEAKSTGDDESLDALALWNLLRTINREGSSGKTSLRGRLEVSNGQDAHKLADKSKVVSDCKTCHRRGSEPFQSVTLTVLGPDGRRVKVGASAEVLSSVISLDSVSGFYAIGGTRIWLLDALLILAFLGGLAVPIGHLTLGWLFKRYLLANAAVTAAGGPADAGAKPAE